MPGFAGGDTALPAVFVEQNYRRNRFGYPVLAESAVFNVEENISAALRHRKHSERDRAEILLYDIGVAVFGQNDLCRLSGGRAESKALHIGKIRADIYVKIAEFSVVFLVDRSKRITLAVGFGGQAGIIAGFHDPEAAVFVPGQLVHIKAVGAVIFAVGDDNAQLIRLAAVQHHIIDLPLAEGHDLAQYQRNILSGVHDSAPGKDNQTVIDSAGRCSDAEQNRQRRRDQHRGRLEAAMADFCRFSSRRR